MIAGPSLFYLRLDNKQVLVPSRCRAAKRASARGRRVNAGCNLTDGAFLHQFCTLELPSYWIALHKGHTRHAQLEASELWCPLACSRGC